MREQALGCQNWLRQALAQPFDGKTVVVTHFAPSLRSSDPRYGMVPGTAGFCSALDELLPRADLWLHGHLHAPSDYVVQGRMPSAAHGAAGSSPIHWAMHAKENSGISSPRQASPYDVAWAA